MLRNSTHAPKGRADSPPTQTPHRFEARFLIEQMFEKNRPRFAREKDKGASHPFSRILSVSQGDPSFYNPTGIGYTLSAYIIFLVFGGATMSYFVLLCM